MTTSLAHTHSPSMWKAALALTLHLHSRYLQCLGNGEETVRRAEERTILDEECLVLLREIHQTGQTLGNKGSDSSLLSADVNPLPLLGENWPPEQYMQRVRMIWYKTYPPIPEEEEPKMRLGEDKEPDLSLQETLELWRSNIEKKAQTDASVICIRPHLFPNLRPPSGMLENEAGLADHRLYHSRAPSMNPVRTTGRRISIPIYLPNPDPPSVSIRIVEETDSDSSDEDLMILPFRRKRMLRNKHV